MAAHQAPIPGSLQARVLEWVAIAFSEVGPGRYLFGIMLGIW